MRWQRGGEEAEKRMAFGMGGWSHEGVTRWRKAGPSKRTASSKPKGGAQHQCVPFGLSLSAECQCISAGQITDCSSKRASC